MRGDLGTSSIVDLCRGLAEASSTGTVGLEGPRGAGNIVFRRGRVVWAQSPAPRARLGDRLVNAALLNQEELDHALEVQARSDEQTKLGALLVEQGLVTRDVIRVFVQEQILDAVFDLMRWRDGSFEFEPGDAVDEKLPVDIPVDQLLVEVSRRQNEWDEIERAIPDLDLVPDFRAGGSSAAAALEPDEFAILANVDGQRSIRDLASHLGYSEFEAARIVYGLTLLGVVSVGGEGPEEDAAEVEAEFDLAPDDDEGELDIGRALEDALRSEEEQAPSPTARPSVRVHIDDEGRFPAPGEPSEEEVATEGTDRSVEEPEPWTPDEDEVAEPVPATDAGDETTEEAPRDLEDDDFETLITQLAGAPGEPPEDTAAPPRTSAEEPEPPNGDPADSGDPTEEPADDRGGSDVSEFLRELSRLAVEEEDSGSEAPRRPERSEEPPPRQRPERPERQDERSDDKKKKGGGFFGWGR